MNYRPNKKEEPADIRPKAGAAQLDIILVAPEIQVGGSGRRIKPPLSKGFSKQLHLSSDFMSGKQDTLIHFLIPFDALS